MVYLNWPEIDFSLSNLWNMKRLIIIHQIQEQAMWGEWNKIKHYKQEAVHVK